MEAKEVKGGMMLLPPAPGKCHLCAVDHGEADPHNAQSLYYAMRFKMQHGRDPRWSDALAHCSPNIINLWARELRRLDHWTDDDDRAITEGAAVAEPTLYAT